MTPRVWAPTAGRVDLVVGADRRPMAPAGGGWWAGDGPLPAGTDYAFALDGGKPLPDPRSPWQPNGVHAASRTVDHTAFRWHDAGWHGRPLPGSVFYELHVGTFTPAGTLDAAVERLPHLVDLGVDVVELMPVNSFDGAHGWGYDGVDVYAVHEPYGGPDGLKRFVDAAHGLGLAVVLDVVYNHLGPSGNYLNRFGPYLTDAYATPWGPAVNLDQPGSDEVRTFIVDNARMWLADYHLDGLRLDAVHALLDQRATHILEELEVSVEALGASLGRELLVVAESESNDPRLVTSRDAGGYGLTGQWSDDFHHALHALLTGERQGYYVDFGSLPTLAKALTRGFVHDGTYSTFRGRHHGRPLDPHKVSGHRLLGYLQDHDQVGNRAAGERTSQLLSPGRLRIGAALVLTSPFTPMLFMGEEWGASTPWQFFTSFADPKLAGAVRTGRRDEFAAHGWTGDVPDPQDPKTLERSKLDWDELAHSPHRELLAWHQDLLRLRREWPELADGRMDLVDVRYDEKERWLVLQRGRIEVACNLSDEPRGIPLSTGGDVLMASDDTTVSGRTVTVTPDAVAVVAHG